MNILPDTHVLLWTITEDNRISEDIRSMIGSARNDIFFSLASLWEVAIKHASKPDVMPISEECFIDACLQSGFRMLPINAKHILTVKTLSRSEYAPPHKDPFDRLLVAQAKSEGMIFVTHDKLLPYYDEPCILYF